MTKFRLIGSFAAVVALSSPSLLRAQTSLQTYASPTGTGTACSAGSPCSLITAINSSTPGTVVSCIDGGFYESNLATSNSITIDCPGAVLSSKGGILLTLNGPNSPVVQVVILRNLTFDGGGLAGAPLIKVTGGATLIIENCKFQNIGNFDAIGIQYLPNSPAAQLVIRDSAFINNGDAPDTGDGLQVAPASGGSASVLLERVSFNFNVTSAVFIGHVVATMINSTVSASRKTGIVVGAGATLDVKDSTLVYNVGSAISVAVGATVRLSNNDIKSNQIGVSNRGQALTYSNNRITGNGATAALTPIPGNQ
jgi:hypothetical protein